MTGDIIILSIVFLPLLTAIIAGLLSSLQCNKLASIITCVLMAIAMACSAITWLNVIVDHQIFHIVLNKWLDFGGLSASWSLYVDSLTAVMLLVVTCISFLVHLYSIAYMKHDPTPAKFMAYLSLFTFFMLMLVTSDNFLQLFFGWEGVGLCSYLLIGFWYQKPAANNAAMKAFIVNRIGDLGLILAMLTIYNCFSSLEFSHVFARVADHQFATLDFLGYHCSSLNLIGVLLFIGCMGKSAQLVLHTWLPDAMEGPTPVSALIHAATMVTAGVFLVVRCSPIFEYASVALEVMCIVGAITCVFATTIAIVQHDIKKIIAYSTCSQLGYMFFACGVSFYSGAMFHLMTHAFFKSLLFLGAGSIIHACSGEQDIRKMGGIWQKLPFTYAMMWIGSLALAGFYPLSGFYSKDALLEAAYVSGSTHGYFAFICGLVAAFFTAFYSWRLLIMVFHGRFRGDSQSYNSIHESPFAMSVVLLILGIASIFVGHIAVEQFQIIGENSSFWQGSVRDKPGLLETMHHIPQFVSILPTIMGLGGICFAVLFYFIAPNFRMSLVARFKFLHNFLYHKWYFDELYDFVFIHSSKNLAKFLADIIDIKIIDGMGPNGTAVATQYMSIIFSKCQTGYIYHYVFIMLLAMTGLISWFVWSAL